MKLSESLSNRTYFVTGIDTDCGKTIATGYIAYLLRQEGVDCITQKLIQTGNTGISEDILLHRRIEKRPLQEVDKDGSTCPLVYSYPCSPHMAIAIDGRVPDYEKATMATHSLLTKYEKVLIEGAGGLMVPLTETYLTRDYIRDEGLPLILVATAKLGSINHTLLSMEVIRHSGITLAAVVYNSGVYTDPKITQETERYLRVVQKRYFPESVWIDLPVLPL